MKKVVSISGFILLVVFMFSSSCNSDSSEGTDIQGSDDVKITGVKVTAFTASVTGTFQGLGKADVALGKHGVLYCPKSDKADAVFKSWQDGNDTPECSVYENKKGFNGESFSGTIEGLYPETEYSFCLFSQGKDGMRKISSAATFATARFSPELGTLTYESVYFIDADVIMNVAIDEHDVSSCTLGVLVSEKSGIKIDSSDNVTEYIGEYGNKMNVVIRQLKPDKSYYGRAYVKYMVSEGKENYIYGPESSFSTKTSDQLAVSLELPSGIKWASCDLGEHKFSLLLNNSTLNI